MSLVSRTDSPPAKFFTFIIQTIMPFCFSHSSSSKYSSIEQQKRRENEYKKFLNTLPVIHQYSPERKLDKPQQMNANRNYFLQRRSQFQYRQEKRKHEYERIEKENIRFSQRLINAKSSFNRSEQDAFFDRHCKLKQRLQHYPDANGNEAKKSDFSIVSKKHWRMVDKPTDSSFLIYNDHRTPQKSKQCRETVSVHPISKTSKSQEKVSHFAKQCSGKSLSITLDIEKAT